MWRATHRLPGWRFRWMRNGGNVRLRVHDNGRGITEGEVNDSKSFGLMGMRERVLLHSGDFQIQGTPGRGTTVVIKLPLMKGQEAP